MKMDSGIESTENSNGSSPDTYSQNLIEIQSDSSCSCPAAEELSSQESFFREPPDISSIKSKKFNESRIKSNFIEMNENANVPTSMNSESNISSSYTLPTNEDETNKETQVRSRRPMEIPRIDVSNYDSETFPKPIFPFPDGCCLKINFPKYISELGRVEEKVTPFINLSKTLSVADGPVEVQDKPCAYDGSMAVLPYESRELQRKFLYYRRRLRQIISTRPKEKKLRIAAGLNNVDLVDQLLNEGVNPKATDERQRTALHIAASKGYTKIVKLLLQHGANPNQKDSVGNTALHLAACTSHIETVTLLLKAGTDVKQADNQGYSPLHLANSRLKLLLNDPNPSSVNLRVQVCQIVEMMQEYLKSSGQTEEAELLTALTSKLTLKDTSTSADGDIKQLLNSLQDLTLSKTKQA